jgi:CRISPR-associated protein Cst2
VERPEKPEYFSLEKIPDIDVKETKKSTKKPKEHFDPIKKTGKVYEVTDAESTRKERASALLKSLAVLRGGAKQAAFGTDVSPKVLIMAGLTCGNPIFNSLFEDKTISTEQRGKNVALNIETMKEIVTDYSDRIRTPVFLGIRTGYMQNESKIKELNNTAVNGIKFVVTTPIDAAKQMSECLNGHLGTTNTTTTQQDETKTQGGIYTRTETSEKND